MEYYLPIFIPTVLEKAEDNSKQIIRTKFYVEIKVQQKNYRK